MASNNTLDMTKGPIFRKLLLFAYPLMISMLITTLYGTADKIIAGRFISDTAMAAVGVSEAPLNLLINFFVSLGVGVSVSCGSHLGANRKKELKECMYTALLSSLICGVAVCVLGVLVSRSLLISMDTPEEILPEALTYMLVRMLGTPLQLMTSFCTNILTAHGDTKRITVMGILSGFVNVVGNLVFVLVFGMGVEALALATVLSQLLTLILKLRILFSPKDAYQLQFSQLRMNWNQTKTIFGVGIPSGVNAILFSASNVIVQAGVNTLGPAVVAGNSAADTLIHFVCLFPNQIASACSCAAAQCYGAHKFKRIDETVKKGLIGSLIMLLAANVVVTVFAMPMLGLFTDDPAVAATGVPNLLFSVWGYALYTFSQIFAAAMRGMHKSVSVMMLNIVGICAPRVLWMWFVFPHFRTPVMLYIVYPISWAISAALQGMAYYRTRKQQESLQAA